LRNAGQTRLTCHFGTRSADRQVIDNQPDKSLTNERSTRYNLSTSLGHSSGANGAYSRLTLFAGFIGPAIDPNEPEALPGKRLKTLVDQLIEAQEKEHSRIARNLHGDICRRLALLSIELEQANRSSNRSPTASKKNLEEVRKHCSEIAGDVQSRSTQIVAEPAGPPETRAVETTSLTAMI
jgi:signal transduction histidine kinase